MATTEEGLELMVQAEAQCPIARQSDLSPIQLPRSVRRFAFSMGASRLTVSALSEKSGPPWCSGVCYERPKRGKNFYGMWGTSVRMY